ncbi:hypothetical protein B484DRAFT_396363 [Ochromonadaceae sp. CCMP2298]|nr:hypothetical protein B484DRAFT_396363 [Ochromonadaceae sp. CCMP2298]
MTVSTLASCCALSLQSWLTDNCLPEEFLDISKFPDALNADPANYAYVSIESAPAILLALFFSP